MRERRERRRVEEAIKKEKLKKRREIRSKPKQSRVKEKNNNQEFYWTNSRTEKNRKSERN